MLWGEWHLHANMNVIPPSFTCDRCTKPRGVPSRGCLISRMERPARRKLTLPPCSVRSPSTRHDPVHFGAVWWPGIWSWRLHAPCKLLLKTFRGTIRGLHMIHSLV